MYYDHAVSKQPVCSLDLKCEDFAMMTIPDGYPSDSAGAFGVLRSRSKLGPDDLKVLAMIEAAGEAFYFRIADGVQDPRAKELLKQNGREERGHAYRLAKILRLQTGEEWTVPSAEDNPFLVSAPAALPAVTPEFIASLEQGEADGDRLYQVWADGATDPEIAKLLRLNGREESRHGERDAEVIRYLTG
jgi:rubrerythrin